MGRTIDEVDFEELKLPQDYGSLTNVKKLLLHIPIRKPNRNEFFRVHPELFYQGLFFEDKNDRELYLIDGVTREEILSELVAKAIFVYVNRNNELKLWPIRLPNIEGKLDGYNRTALGAAEEAKVKWVRVKTEEGVGFYVVEEAGLQKEPKWPSIVEEDGAMAKILKIAFKDNFIDSLDHPVLQKAVFGNL